MHPAKETTKQIAASCRGELKHLLRRTGKKASCGIQPDLEHDYEISVTRERVSLIAQRPRALLNALGDVENAQLSGQGIRPKQVKSPFQMRLVEAWAPMHSHRYLPLPEFHEHNWATRLRITDKKRVNAIEPEAPEVEMAIIRFERYAELVAKRGYTGLVLDGQEHLVLYPDIPQIYPAGSHYYRCHTVHRRLQRKLLEIARKYDMEFYLFCQEVEHTEPIMDYVGNLCPLNPKLWHLIEAKYDEIISDFPDIAGYMFKISDSVGAYDPYHYQDIYRHECPQCRKLSGEERLHILAEKLHDIIVKKHGKKFLFRTWDVKHGIHRDIEKQKKLFDGLNGRDSFPVLKHTHGDFQIGLKLHPGIGKMPNQIVEYQFKLEHDGHGTIPLYVGHTFERSLRQNIKKNIRGVWTWPMGGGKASINTITFFKGFTQFIEANEFVFAKLMMEPETSHRDALAQWGNTRLGKGNGRILADIFMQSEKACQRLLYFGTAWKGERLYASTKVAGREMFNLGHHRWFFDWQQFYLGEQVFDEAEAARIFKKGILPNLTSLEDAIDQIKKGRAGFRKMLKQYAQTIVPKPQFEETYHAMHHHLRGADAFAELYALYVEAVLRFYDGGTGKRRMSELLHKLSEAKLSYDRNYGIYVTQIIDVFCNMVESTLNVGKRKRTR
jgi:hypothetical protein